MNNKTTRESNFELLRIITIFIIIMHHLVVHSDFSLSEVTITSNKAWIILCKQGGMLGNNIFPIISGYYLSQKKEIKYNRAIKLWLQMLFYSLAIYFVFIICQPTQFSLGNTIKYCFPVTTKCWWFATIYIYLFLLSPFINIIINNISETIYRRLIIVSFIILCFIPTITGLQGECNDLVWFVFLYLIGGYIAREKENIKGKWVYLIMAILGCISIAIIYIVPISFISEYKDHLLKYQFVPAFIISVFIVVFTAKCKTFSCKVINIISSASFGVYLIHENEYVRELIWDKIFSVKNHINDKIIYLVLYTLLACILIYIVCTIVELIRASISSRIIRLKK